MNFNIHAIFTDGTTAFRGTLGFVPRIGEQIEINGYTSVVKSVKYILEEGSFSETCVQLLLG